MKLNETNFKINDQINTFTKDNYQVNVRKYLPISDKIDLVQIALQKAEEDGIYNQIKLDMYFHLNIIYLYTNIEISQEEREDEMKLYDILESNDIIDTVIAFMDQDEYNELKGYLMEMESNSLAYRNTAAAVLTKIIQDLPKNAAAAKEIVDSFDPSKYQEVINFATAANGGRNINTNAEPVNNEGNALSTAARSVVSSIEPKSKKVVKIKQATKKD